MTTEGGSGEDKTPSVSRREKREKDTTKLTLGLRTIQWTRECGRQDRHTVEGCMWKAMVTSTGKEMAGACSSAFFPPPSASSGSLSSPLSESLLLSGLAPTVAAMVGRTTCSTNSSRLGVRVMSSGVDATTTEMDSTPCFTGGSGGWGWRGVSGVTLTFGRE